VYSNLRHEANAILHNYEEVVDELYMEEREGRTLTFYVLGGDRNLGQMSLRWYPVCNSTWMACSVVFSSSRFVFCSEFMLDLLRYC